MTIGDHIRPHLARLGWSKGTLARKCGFSQPRLSALLAKLPNDVQPRTLYRLAGGLSVSTDIFFSKTVSAHPTGSAPEPGNIGAGCTRGAPCDDEGTARGVGHPHKAGPQNRSEGP